MDAEFLSKSYGSAVHVTLTAEAHVNGLKNLITNKDYDPEEPLTLTGVLISCFAKSVALYPYMNVAYAEGNRRVYKSINVGLAVANPDGTLSVPVVQNADQKTIQEIDKERAVLADLARKKKLRMEHLKGASITLSNMGMFRSMRYASPIIPFGQGAILATCAINDAFSGSGFDVKSWRLPLSLSFDHRIINGIPAAEFLQTFVNMLESY